MKRSSALLILLSALLAFSCKQEPKYGGPIVSPESIIKNPMNFSVYQYKYVRLSEDFTALDSAENILDRGTFLKQLSSGRYLPLRLRTKDSAACYQLYNIPDTAEFIRSTMAQWANNCTVIIKWKGKNCQACLGWM